MRALSLFTGVGGFDLGMERAGFDIIGQCEIDPYRRQILERHWPEVPCHDDVTRFHPPDGVDFLFGGFPCQDLSVAGRRAGLEGDRSGLFFEFARVADECIRPGGWILIENVPGLLSSPGKDRKGADFRVLLGYLADLGFHDIAWRVLDSRYFGVPQRRRRVFILARRARGDRAATVLLDPEGGGGHPTEGRKKGKANRRTTVRGTGKASDEGRGASAGEVEEPTIASALDRRAGGADDNDAQANHIIPVGMGASDPDVSGTLGARGTSGGQTTDVDRAGAYIVDTLRSHPRPGSNSDGALVLAFNWQSGGSKDWFGLKEGETDALSKNQVPAVYVAAPLTRGSATGKGVSVPGRRQEDDHNLALALDVRNMKAEDVAKTLLGGEHQSYSLNNMSVIVRGVDELSGPLTKRYAKGVNTTMDDGAMAIVENQRAEVWEKPYAQQVTTGGGKVGQGYNAARIGTEVRRLTPTECERLQGFPDGWTLVNGPSLAMMPSWYELPFRLLASPSEPAPDGRRYAAMGDAVTVPVAEWIGRRILALEGAA